MKDMATKEERCFQEPIVPIRHNLILTIWGQVCWDVAVVGVAAQIALRQECLTMRILVLITASICVCGLGAQTAAEAQTQTATQRAGAALAASDECGGKLTDAMNNTLVLAIQQEGTGAVKAAELSMRALWAESGVRSDAVMRDAICAGAFRNGWIQ